MKSRCRFDPRGVAGPKAGPSPDMVPGCPDGVRPFHRELRGARSVSGAYWADGLATLWRKV